VVLLCFIFVFGPEEQAGRIYAGGLLRFGGRVKLKDAWRSASD
jgi:hypothetical protein